MDLTKAALIDTLASDDIDNFTTLAIVNARNLCSLTKAVIDLNMFNSLSGDTLQHLRDIATEKLVAIDINLLNNLSVCLHTTIGNGYARHFTKQRLNLGIYCHLKSVGIVSERVAHNNRTS